MINPGVKSSVVAVVGIANLVINLIDNIQYQTYMHYSTYTR